MKRIISVFLFFVLLLSCLAACGGAPAETTVPPTTTAPLPTETAPAVTTLPPETEDLTLSLLRQNLPRMDGSTSLIPLEAGIRAALFGISQEEAEQQVSHTTSWGSFYNLLSGQVDLVFSVPLSPDQEAAAVEQGVTLEAIPIAMEGFVFVVNADNPVDSLTQQQIRDIYTGKISNWAQVGGLDEEIIPYQRNHNSGSQNYMRAFMGSTPLMDAPTELRPASMFGLMEVIAAMDNSRAAIGYSVYAYAADMYGNGNEIKFIQVDGVAPSKSTFADGSYPLLGCNYAVFRADEPEDSFVRQLVDWIVSDEGQLAIAQAGYVAIRDIGFDYTEATLNRYEGTGAGPTAPEEAPTHEYVVLHSVLEQYDWGSYLRQTNSLPLTEDSHLSSLGDKNLEAEINAWIDRQFALLRPMVPEMEEAVERLNSSAWSGLYSDNFGDMDPVFCEISLKNGYLSAAVSLRYWKNGNNEHFKYYRTETAVWDLLTGEKLDTEALFCRGVDIAGTLNNYISRYTQTSRGEFSHQPELKQDFAALTADGGWHLTMDGIFIDYGSDTFVNGEFIPFDPLPDGILAAEIPRDFASALLTDESLSVIRRIRVSDRDLTYAYYARHPEMEIYDVELLREDFHPNAARINAHLLDYLASYYTVEDIRAWFTDQGYNADEVELFWLSWYSELLGGRYFLTMGNNPYVYIPSENRFVYYPHDAHLLYDLETGQRVDWTEVLKDGWLDAATMCLTSNDQEVTPVYHHGMVTEWFRYYNDIDCFTICLNDGQTSYYLYIPGEYIIF